MAVRFACLNARLWLQTTITRCSVIPYRNVSTTSAIKKGLRAERRPARPVRHQDPGRDEGRRDGRDGDRRSGAKGRGGNPPPTSGVRGARWERRASSEPIVDALSEHSSGLRRKSKRTPRSASSRFPDSIGDRRRDSGYTKSRSARNTQQDDQIAPRTSRERGPRNATGARDRQDRTSGRERRYDVPRSFETAQTRVPGRTPLPRASSVRGRRSRADDRLLDGSGPERTPSRLSKTRGSEKTARSVGEEYDKNKRLLDELTAALKDGTGPYSHIRKDELLVRINNTIRALSRSTPKDQNETGPVGEKSMSTGKAYSKKRISPDKDVLEDQREVKRLLERHDTSLEDATIGQRSRRTIPKDEDGMPISIPRTAAASIFLYGANTVLAALRANRRKLHRLYVGARASEPGSSTSRASTAESDTSSIILRTAKELQIDVKRNAPRDLLDAMAEDRPHNGFVLEATELPAPPIQSLGKVNEENSLVPLRLEPQSAEDAAVNGTPRSLQLGSHSRAPFVLMLDGILDPQNLGNILRTAFFYGVDAVAVSVNTCCPINSPALAKASSGACEAVDILAIQRPGNFLHKSKFAGWKVAAAVAPEINKSSNNMFEAETHPQGPPHLAHTDIASFPLHREPTILMLGAEGDGLRDSLKARADYFVSIAAAANLQGRAMAEKRALKAALGVDSINVGTAAGVLIDCFLRPAPSVKPAGIDLPVNRSEEQPVPHDSEADVKPQSVDSVEVEAADLSTSMDDGQGTYA